MAEKKHFNIATHTFPIQANINFIIMRGVAALGSHFSRITQESVCDRAGGQ